MAKHYARLLRMHLKIDRIDTAKKIFEESVIPLCKSQKGFLGAYFLADKESGTCIPITVWESEEDMLATERNAFFQEQIIKFMPFFKSPPIREGYEVVVSE
jgi:heme-degrading monooxygenase HmoA